MMVALICEEQRRLLAAYSTAVLELSNATETHGRDESKAST
jgi:hypothetical protein